MTAGDEPAAFFFGEVQDIIRRVAPQRRLDLNLFSATIRLPAASGRDACVSGIAGSGTGWIQTNRKGKRVTENQDETVFREAGGKTHWLIQHIAELDEGERALLLAMVELDKQAGRTFTDEERAALDKLAAETHDFSPVEIQDAVQKMVEGKAKRQPAQGWPTGLGRKAGRAKKK